MTKVGVQLASIAATATTASDKKYLRNMLSYLYLLEETKIK